MGVACCSLLSDGGWQRGPLLSCHLSCLVEPAIFTAPCLSSTSDPAATLCPCLMPHHTHTPDKPHGLWSWQLHELGVCKVRGWVEGGRCKQLRVPALAAQHSTNQAIGAQVSICCLSAQRMCITHSLSVQPPTGSPLPTLLLNEAWDKTHRMRGERAITSPGSFLTAPPPRPPHPCSCGCGLWPP